MTTIFYLKKRKIERKKMRNERKKRIDMKKPLGFFYIEIKKIFLAGYPASRRDVNGKISYIF